MSLYQAISSNLTIIKRNGALNDVQTQTFLYYEKPIYHNKMCQIFCRSDSVCQSLYRPIILILSAGKKHPHPQGCGEIWY